MKKIQVRVADVDYWQLHDRDVHSQAGDGLVKVSAGGQDYEVAILRTPAGRGFRYEVTATHRVWRQADGPYAEVVSPRMFEIVK